MAYDSGSFECMQSVAELRAEAAMSRTPDPGSYGVSPIAIFSASVSVTIHMQ